MKSSEIEQRTNMIFFLNWAKWLQKPMKCLSKFIEMLLWKIWTWYDWVQNLFHAFCHNSRKNSSCRVAWSCKFRFRSFYEVRSLVVKPWIMVTILKRKRRVITGKHWIRRELRKRVNRNHMWKSSWPFSSIVTESFVLSSCLEVPL
jgi:hypothetical protein